MACTSCSHRHTASMSAHQMMHKHQPPPHAIVYAAHSHHRCVTNSTPMCTQEGLFRKLVVCPKPDCGQPLVATENHGVRVMKCTKKTCRATHRPFVSSYFDNKGASQSLPAAHSDACPYMHHTSTPTCRPPSSWCTWHTCIRPRGTWGTGYRQQLELALIFAWGSARI